MVLSRDPLVRGIGGFDRSFRFVFPTNGHSVANQLQINQLGPKAHLLYVGALRAGGVYVDTFSTVAFWIFPWLLNT